MPSMAESNLAPLMLGGQLPLALPFSLFTQSLDLKNLCSKQGKSNVKEMGSFLLAWRAGEGMGGNCAKGHSVPGQHVPALKSESCQCPGRKNAAGCSTCQASNRLGLGLGLRSSCTLQGGTPSRHPLPSPSSTLRNLGLQYSHRALNGHTDISHSLWKSATMPPISNSTGKLPFLRSAAPSSFPTLLTTS